MNYPTRHAVPHGLLDLLQKWNRSVVALFLFAGMAVTAHAQTVANAGFESGSLSSWIYSVGSVTWSNTNAHTGTGAVNITNHGTCLQTVTGLTPNTTYTLVAWGKLGSPCTAWIGVNNYGGAQVMATVTGTTYQQYSVNFTTGATNTAATVWIGNGSTSGTVYGDDFSIGFKPLSDPSNSGNWIAKAALSDEFNGTTLDTTKWKPYSYWAGREPSQFDPANIGVSGGYLHLYTQNKNMLVNGNFETNTLAGWSNPGGGAAMTTLSTGESSNYYYGSKLTVPGSSLQQTITVLPNTEYMLTSTFKVSSTGITPKVTVGVVSPVATLNSVSSLWSYNKSIKFTTAAGQTSVTIYGQNDGGTGSIAYFDEVSLVPTTLPSGLKFTANKGNYIAAAVINSLTMPTFGYYEARMKIAQDAHFSSFWMKQEVSGTIKTQEIDIAEQIGDPNYYTAEATKMKINTWYWPVAGTAYTNPQPYTTVPAIHLADAFHVYAVDWQADQLRFYFDGTLVKTIPQVVPPLTPSGNGQTQVLNMQTLWFDTEVMANYGIPDDGSASDFQVDYVRAWTH